MFKTLIACKCDKFICVSKGWHKENDSFHDFNPDEEYIGWRNFKEGDCSRCNKIYNYFVVKKEDESPGNFTTYQIDHD